MSMLNFKYGAFANLPARSAATNGTIYITTDEQAMYVDLDNQRIRLSQIITLSNAEWQALTPPYSTEAFYYISDANALLKYSGTAWVQLNSKKDLQDALAGLGFLGVLNSKPTTNVVKGQICTVGNKNYIYNGTAWADCGLVGAEILDLKATVASHTQTLATHTQDITDLKNKDTAIEGDIALLKKGVGYTGSGTTLPTNPAEGDIFVHSGTVKVYCKNPATEKTAAWHAVGNVSKRLEDLRAHVEAVAAAAGDKSAVEKLQQDLADLSQTVAGIDAASLGVGDFKDKTVAGIKSDFTGKVADGNTGFTTGDAVYDAIAAAKTAVLGQANYGQTVKSAYEAAGQAAQAASGAQATADAITQGATSLTTLKKVEEKFAELKVQDLTDAGTLATDDELAAAKTAILGKNDNNTGDFSGTVKGAYANASAASQAAAGAQATADAITKDATTLTTLKKVEEKFAGLTVSDLTNASILATDDELAAAKTAVLGQENGKDFAGTVKGAYANASTAQSTANTAKADAKTANDDIAAIKNGATITTFKGIE